MTDSVTLDVLPEVLLMSREEVTVARLLEERLLRGAPVLAGDRMDAPVHWCHSLHDLETPARDLAGVAVMADAADLSPQRLGELADAGAAAVFVFGGTVPGATTGPGTADAGDGIAGALAGDGMVLVAVPPGTTFRTLAELVARLALAHESHVLRYAQHVHSSLAQLLHRGAGVEAICSRMVRLTGCTVAVVSPDLRLMAFEQGPNTWLDPTALGAAFRPLQEQVARDFAAGTTRGHGAGPGGPGGAGSGGPGGAGGSGGGHQHASAVVPVTVADRPVTAVLAPIDLVDRRDGWVVVVDAHDPPHEHDLAEHRVVVEQAATIVGTELLRVRSVERAEERARGNFVHALLHGRFSTHADLVARAAHHDFPVEGRHAVLVARSRGLIAESDASTRLAEMARAAGRLLPVEGRQTLAAVVGDVLAVVRPVGPAGRGPRDASLDDLRTYAAALEQRLAAVGRKPVAVAFGRPVSGGAAIVESYREARVALDLRERLRVDHVCGFADLRVDSALLELAQSATGQGFSEDILEPLRAERDGSLVEVARAYVMAGGNVNEASRELGVHRNTTLYKLDKISRLLQRDVREADTQFTIWLALRMADLAQTAELVDRDLSTGG